ncbi:ArsC family transcriptional regulator [Halolamina sp.]|jgi:arsenate reductase|uniref:arsenate reductase/protein-tyrosine-phosphatase family protein n=1 Tax=Halolamina sp. TaxID=1940283 RepID=UPI000223B6A3|nr:protein tyrosine phosphatase [halophilic archaeon DL31]
MLNRTDSDATRIAFVCVGNAGRSQMAYAFAQRELAERGFQERYELLTGGVDPADQLHEEVVDAMAAVGIDIGDRTPRAFTAAEARTSEYVITMGCAASDACPVDWTGKTIEWGLTGSHGNQLEETVAVQDEIARRVSTLFDELEKAA